MSSAMTRSAQNSALDRSATRALSRDVRQMDYITALTQAAQCEVSQVYAHGVSIGVATLEHIDTELRCAARNGMPEDQLAALYADVQTYQAVMSTISVEAARQIAGVVAGATQLPPPGIIDRLLGG